jgi:hypothetical protein
MPERLPFHVPARLRMCFWTWLSTPVLFRTTMTFPRVDHSNSVPGTIPNARRISMGIVVVPLLVTTVSFVMIRWRHSQNR